MRERWSRGSSARRGRSLLLLPLLLAGCLGERARPGADTRRVAVDPDVVNFSRRGDQLILAGRMFRGAVLVTDSTAFAWRSMDSAVASVTPDGVLTARGDGVTRVWGVSGTDSGFAVVVVETPVAPVVVTVAPLRMQFSALNATALLNVATSDTLARDSLPVCRTDDPRVAVVESLTVRARGNGTTRLRCGIAGVDGSAPVSVTVSQRIARVRVTADVPFVLREGRDSLTVSLARVDSLRQPVVRGAPQFVSLDSGIVRVDPMSGTVVGAKIGTGRIVGSIEGFADTAVIRVVENAAPTVVSVSPRRAGGAASASARRPGVRTIVSRTGAPRPSNAQVGARDYAERDSVFQAGGPAGLAPFAHWAPALYGAYVERRILDEINGIGPDVGSSTGFMFGASLEAQPARRFRVTLGGLYGSLTSGNTNGELGTAVEATADVSVSPFSWFWFQLGVGRRAFKPEFGALGQWTSVRVGGEARYGFGKDALQGIIRGLYMPLVSVTGVSTRPSVATAWEAGVDYRSGTVNVGVRYGLERLDFPVTAGFRRREQFATLRLRFGLELGR